MRSEQPVKRWLDPSWESTQWWRTPSTVSALGCSPLRDQRIYGVAADGEALECQSQGLDDRHDPPAPALGLFRHQAAPARVGLTADLEHPSVEVDVTDTKARDLADPQPRGGQNRHHVAVGLVTTGIHDALHETLQSPHIGQREVAWTMRRADLRGAADSPTASAVLGWLRAMSPSRTASSRTSTNAETVFFTVDRPYCVSHSSMAQSTRPALMSDTGRCPSVGKTRSRIPLSTGRTSTSGRCLESNGPR
jgi:hypothetical protein